MIPTNSIHLYVGTLTESVIMLPKIPLQTNEQDYYGRCHDPCPMLTPSLPAGSTIHVRSSPKSRCTRVRRTRIYGWVYVEGIDMESAWDEMSHNQIGPFKTIEEYRENVEFLYGRWTK